MKILRVVSLSFGSVCVYLGVAACSAVVASPGALDAPDAGTTSVLDPVAEAAASTDGGVEAGTAAKPQPVEEMCSHQEKYPDGGLAPWFYAEHFYPGKTKSDLMRVVALAHETAGLWDGYEDVTVAVLVKDEYVKVGCQGIDHVSFLLPE